KSLQNLERDLKPLEDKIHYLEKLAAEVKKKNPEEAAAIEKKIAQLRALHNDLLRRAHDKIKIAEQSQGQEMFESALKDVLNWIDRTKKALSEDVRALDVQQAEDLLKKHYELGEQIKDKKYEVEYVQELGQRLLEKNPRLREVEAQLKHLGTEMAMVKNMYRIRDAQLKEQLDLQLFNREAERIDAATKGHEAFLDYADLGLGTALIAQKHYESPNVERLLKRLNTEWAELRDAVNRKGEKLRQASDQKGLNRILEDAHAKLDELESVLKSDELGSDLRAVKDLIQKHSVLEQEMGIYENKVTVFYLSVN
ncbi:unnamed protein product, partial [Strongylus vulgaris]